jgi:hypothetical protein
MSDREAGAAQVVVVVRCHGSDAGTVGEHRARAETKEAPKKKRQGESKKESAAPQEEMKPTRRSLCSLSSHCP